jgi:hypothetical protein
MIISAVEAPWQINSSGLVRFVKPTQSRFRPGAGADVEAALGVGLPTDNTNMIVDGLAWTLGQLPDSVHLPVIDGWCSAPDCVVAHG